MSIATPRAAAVYTRISKDDGTALGVDRQERDCRALATGKGWQVVQVYTDNDVSASRGKARPAFERMLADVRAGQVDAVVVWDVDRLTRTPRELEDVIDFADRHRLQLASVGGDIDLATEQGRLTARLKGNVARYEVEQMSRRIKAKHTELAQSGAPAGRQAFGYDRVRTVEGERVVVKDVINREEAAALQEAAERVLAGEGLWRIVKDWRERGIRTKTGGEWVTQTLRRTLLRVRYAGKREHNGRIVSDAAWEPIFTMEQHERLTAYLRNPARRTSRDTRVKYLLSNLARCGVCGGRVVGTAEFKYEYRTFPHRLVCNNAGCHKVSRMMAPVDEVVESALLAVLARDGLVLLAGQPEVAKAARERIQTLEAKLALVADDYAEDRITGEQLTRITARVRQDLDAERARLRSAEPDAVLPDLGADPAAAWAAADIATRRAVVDALCTVTLHPQGPGKPFDPATVEITLKVG